MSDRNIRTLKSDKPPASPPPKEGDDPFKKIPKLKEKKNSPKGKEPENGVKPGIRKRNIRDPDPEPTKKLVEKTDENIQIKPMKDEVSTCHSHCGPSSIDANLLTCFSFLTNPLIIRHHHKNYMGGSEFF